MSPREARILEIQKLCHGKHHEAALALTEQLLAKENVFGALHAIRIDILLSLARRHEAETAFDNALNQVGSHPDALDGLAFYARRLGRHALSNKLYGRAVAARPRDAQLWYNLATSERSLGRLLEAREACQRALSIQPGHMPALLLRSEVRTATALENHVHELESKLSSPLGNREQMFVAYALGKELHDLNRYEGAFAAFALGARARRSNLAYDVATDERKIDRIIEVFDESPVAATNAAYDRHIFIVGLPRSGTTLVERILGSLPSVESNGETDNFSTALLQSAPAIPGDVFERCRAAPADEVARRYDALAGRNTPTTRVIEKLPLNYLYVGSIAAAFAHSPIVWVRRHPLDSCFAMFRTLFGEGYPFSYDLDDLARYYAAYDRLMRHWIERLPGRIIKVDYEDLVRAPAIAAATLAQECGLTWRDDALDLSRNQSASLTASAAQVRGSIYATSAGIRQRYRAQLAPLARRLRELGVHLPD